MAESKTEYSRWSILYILVLSLTVSIISGMASGWYFSKFDNKEIVVLDVLKIIEAKKKEFIEKYREREANPQMKEEMERELSFFIDRLNRIVEEESRGRIVLVRDSVISEAKDITNDVEGKIKSTH
jgi:hypothetical protein